MRQFLGRGKQGPLTLKIMNNNLQNKQQDSWTNRSQQTSVEQYLSDSARWQNHREQESQGSYYLRHRPGTQTDETQDILTSPWN